MNPNKMKDRCVGTIAGFAIGDALGMPAAFLSRDQIRHYYGKPISCFIKAHPGHASESLPQGSYTDNTETMLATAECLLECGRMDPARHADALLSWFVNRVPHRTPAEANLKACKHLSAGRPWNKSGVFSNCCAAAMRMPPIGLFFHRFPDTLMRAAVDNCLITHNEPRARAACVAVAYLTARLILSSDHSSPGDQVLETADHIAHMDADLAAVLRRATQIVHLPPEKALFEIGTSSDCVEAIPASVYCFLKYPGKFSSAVLSAANAGDAADSIAALTGSFVGALAGVDAIDSPWLGEVENSELLVGVGENIARMLGRPETGAV